MTGGVAVGVIAVFFAIYVVRLLTILDQWAPDEFTSRAVSLAVGVFGVTLIYSSRTVIEARPLAWLGAFSFGIYLLHVFGAAGARIALGKVGVTSELIVFGFCLAVGIGLPIAFHKLFSNWNPTRVGILGEKRTRRVLSR